MIIIPNEDKKLLSDFFETRHDRPTFREYLIFGKKRFRDADYFIGKIADRLGIEHKERWILYMPENSTIQQDLSNSFIDWVRDETHYALERKLGLKWDFDKNSFNGLTHDNYKKMRDKTLIAVGRKAMDLFNRAKWNEYFPEYFPNLRNSIENYFI